MGMYVVTHRLIVVKVPEHLHVGRLVSEVRLIDSAELQHFFIRNAGETTCPIHGQAPRYKCLTRQSCGGRRNAIRSQSMLCRQRRCDRPV